MCDVKQNIAKLVEDLEIERIHVPVVACGIGTNARDAVKAIQAGAKEYIPLPPDAELIAAVLEAVTEESNTMIASDPAMKNVMQLAEKIAPSEATVLITGESGTGKEVMSSFIHRKSKRKDGPFIAVNCAAIPENLLESELFGHEKGAFTGANGRRIGKFEEAHGGTILLDEVSEMHPLLQAKLLRAIQEKKVTRIGSNDEVKVDTRIIATSNRNLEASVQKESEIEADAIFLQESDFTQGASASAASPTNAPSAAGVSPSAPTVENTEGVEILIGRTISDVERDMIVNTLDHCLGNRTHAAKILGISIRTLRNKLNQYKDEGVDIPQVG
ncbi:unnamed protein product [Cyprideis torosa]|uniref:Uncharacterized protein n=1 Tax=Cyprideis torosa TaxID=163714 RepID=A0A7R8WJL6_9CRUS|nr:unnamed protein product [Cyprideis torosa]CAG0902155.1 unnamed protein product [Cyprideis torosa]